MGITSRPWGGATSDAGMTLVDPLHRGKGIARQVAVGLAQQSVALGLIGVHDYPVTVHGATQRLAKGFGVDTGLMLVNMPADVAFREMETPAPGQRSSSLMRWLPFGRAPQRDVYLPERYHERLVSLYAEARLPRSIREADATVSVQLSELEVVLDTRRKIARIGVTRIGADLDARVEAETRTASDGGAIVGTCRSSSLGSGRPLRGRCASGHGIFVCRTAPGVSRWRCPSRTVAFSRSERLGIGRSVDRHHPSDRGICGRGPSDLVAS